MELCFKVVKMNTNINESTLLKMAAGAFCVYFKPNVK